jgi:hypothetical protein
VHVGPRVSPPVPSGRYLRQWCRRGDSYSPFSSLIAPLERNVLSLRRPSQLAELKMNYFSYWIRSQPDWWLAFKNEDTAVRMEGHRTARGLPPGRTDSTRTSGQYRERYGSPGTPLRFARSHGRSCPFTEGQIDWVLDELSDFAARRVPRDHVQVSSSCVDPF